MLTIYSWNSKAVFCNLDTITKEHTEKELANKKLSEITKLVFEEDVEKIQTGVIELFPSVEQIIFPNTIKSIPESTELASLLIRNKVLIRGYYDTYGESFAKKHFLKFVHADIVLGIHRENNFEGSQWKLCFEDSGKPYLHYESWTQGSSPGHTLGGERRCEIETDFYVGCTVEKFASRFGSHFSGLILKNQNLKNFLASANARLK